mgnify:CR=1 FL=1
MPELSPGPCRTHTFATAASRSLEEHRVPYCVRDGSSFRVPVEAGYGTRDDRNAALLRRVPRRNLVADGVQCLDSRANEHDAPVRTGLGERRVFREEAIPRVYGVSPGLPCHGEDLIDVKIALPGGCAADSMCLVRVPDMECLSIDVAVQGDGMNPQLAAGSHDADCNLAPVCYQDAAERYSCWHVCFPVYQAYLWLVRSV